MLNWDDVLAAAPTLVTRESDGELVVVLPEKGKFVVLNATGARVLHLSNGTRTLREIADTLAAEFDADQTQVEGDVLRFAKALVDRGALHVR
ncbi:MAG: pyrroloquinoline quinone biosynthesis peptide chaperone PqqD [Anaerolineae bacterium]|nr:pyrroloquinoline quinone biosynthesis peptide chaperone PqqD [Anaerolineae bacterium]